MEDRSRTTEVVAWGNNVDGVLRLLSVVGVAVILLSACNAICEARGADLGLFT